MRIPAAAWLPLQGDAVFTIPQGDTMQRILLPLHIVLIEGCMQRMRLKRDDLLEIQCRLHAPQPDMGADIDEYLALFHERQRRQVFMSLVARPPVRQPRKSLRLRAHHLDQVLLPQGEIDTFMQFCAFNHPKYPSIVRPQVPA